MFSSYCWTHGPKILRSLIKWWRRWWWWQSLWWWWRGWWGWANLKIVMMVLIVMMMALIVIQIGASLIVCSLRLSWGARQHRRLIHNQEVGPALIQSDGDVDGNEVFFGDDDPILSFWSILLEEIIFDWLMNMINNLGQLNSERWGYHDGNDSRCFCWWWCFNFNFVIVRC